MGTDVERLLRSYPRTRRPLPPELREIYEDVHLTSREGRTFLHRVTQGLEGWMHKRIAADSAPGQELLEIGAGTLNHLRWENAGQAYDVVEPFTALYQGRAETQRVRTFYADIVEVPPENRYDRIISIASLEHVLDLPRLVARAALRLKPGGSFHAGIPSEGGLLWGTAWRASVGLSFRIRTGLNYGDLMRYEHVSQAPEIIAVVRHCFKRCRIKRFPTPWHHLSLYAYLSCEDPELDRCRLLVNEELE